RHQRGQSQCCRQTRPWSDGPLVELEWPLRPEEIMSAAAALDTELEAFRNEARTWLAANFPSSLKNKGAMMFMEGRGPADADFMAWKKAMGEKGWGTPTWPREYGGGGLTRAQARVLQQEMTRIGAFSPIGGMGVGMFGPTLLEYGNDAQKKRHVPPIVK